jgi:hypothetical protein
MTDLGLHRIKEGTTGFGSATAGLAAAALGVLGIVGGALLGALRAMSRVSEAYGTTYMTLFTPPGNRRTDEEERY